MSIFSKILHILPRPLRRIRTLVLLVILLVVWWFLNRGAADMKQITTVKVTRGTITSEVAASGSITSPFSSTLYFAVPGKVVYLPFKEGEKVKKGQVVATLDNEKYQIAVREAQWSFEAAKAEFDRYYDTARGRSSETFDQRVERTAIDQQNNNAYEALLLAKRNLRDTVITAPFDGTLTKLDVHVGEQVQAATQIGEIVDISSLDFSADIDETDIGKIKMGQKVTLLLDAYPDEKLPTTIKKISEISTSTSTGATAYEVSFEIPRDGKLRHGMNGEVTILTDEEKNVLIVPLEAIVDDKYVWVDTGNGYEKKQVSLGVVSDIDAEVLSGLSENQSVVTTGFDELTKKSLLQRVFSR
ncbi:MAG: hypothetical protein RLZZ455_734 [Candidatus Parcubacteria bacterium]